MSELAKVLENIELNEDRFLGLLEKLIGVAEHLQNNPAQGIVSISLYMKNNSHIDRTCSQGGYGF